LLSHNFGGQLWGTTAEEDWQFDEKVEKDM
jgi:hypothetical protein